MQMKRITVTIPAKDVPTVVKLLIDVAATIAVDEIAGDSNGAAAPKHRRTVQRISKIGIVVAALPQTFTKSALESALAANNLAATGASPTISRLIKDGRITPTANKGEFFKKLAPLKTKS